MRTHFEKLLSNKKGCPTSAHVSKMKTHKESNSDKSELHKSSVFKKPKRSYHLICLSDLSEISGADNVPFKIDLNPEIADVITFGRVSLNDANDASDELPEARISKQHKYRFVQVCYHDFNLTKSS